jgi:hypothetical protein
MLQERLGRPVAIALLLALIASIGIRGVVPALQRVDSDFPGYFTSAKIVADGGDVSRLYDAPWFRAQIRHYQVGDPGEGKFQPFPPPTALLLLPVTRLAPLNALRAVTVVNLICLIISIYALSRMFSWSWLGAALFVLLSQQAIISGLRFGQPYMVVSLFCILGYWAYIRGRHVLAGICFGLFVPIKYFPIVYLAYFACRKNWKLALSGAATIAAITLVSVAVLGWSIHWQFVTSVLGNHLIGDLPLQGKFAASYQSFDALFHRLFIFDAAGNPMPWIALPQLASIAIVITKGAILVATLVALVRLQRAGGATGVALSVGLLGVTTLLLAPATATYHMALLWLPVALLIAHPSAGRPSALQLAILGAYVLLIGFIPYGHTGRWEGIGLMTVLAFPRLFLLSALFIASLRHLRQSTPSLARDAPYVA